MFARRLLVALSLLSPALVHAQSTAPLNPATYGLVYDLPGTRDVRVHADVPYAVVGRDTLTLDVYVPPGLRGGETRGAVLFVNGIGDQRPDRVKRWGIYATWPRVVAASGLIGISMDASRDSVQRSISGALDFITGARGRRLGIDTANVALYAASANVRATLEYLNAPARSRSVRAAALYYGFPPAGAIPRVPTMFIVAQGDVPNMRPLLDSLWKRVVDSAAPWTLVFGRDMPHAFDAFTDSDDSRRIIRETLGFWRNHLEPLPRFAPRPTESAQGRAIVETFYANDHARSAELLTEWTRDHPDDALAFERLGIALTNVQRRAEAGQAFRRALALDTARASAHAGLATLGLAEGRWADAAASLERAIALGLETSLTRGQLGYAQIVQGRYEEGARNYERSFELGIPPGNGRGVAAYNLACAYARLGRADDAFRMLDVAVENGMRRREQFEGDEDLASLRGDPRFRRLMERLS